MSKGELLKLQAHVVSPVEWEGRVFERALDCETTLPEAYAAHEGLLPHLHPDLHDRFPQAVARQPTPDVDPPSHEGLETRGRALGEKVVRYEPHGELPHREGGAAQPPKEAPAERRRPT